MNQRLNEARLIRKLEKIAYTLERVFEGVKERKAQRELERTIASWTRVCRGCDREFFPSMTSQRNCINCQGKSLAKRGKEGK